MPAQLHESAGVNRRDDRHQNCFHVGRNKGKSSDYFLPPGVIYEIADLSPIAVDDGDITFTFTKTFKLLGSVLAYDLNDTDATECQIKSVLGAYSAIQKAVFQCKSLRN